VLSTLMTAGTLALASAATTAAAATIA